MLGLPDLYSFSAEAFRNSCYYPAPKVNDAINTIKGRKIIDSLLNRPDFGQKNALCLLVVLMGCLLMDSPDQFSSILYHKIHGRVLGLLTGIVQHYGALCAFPCSWVCCESGDNAYLGGVLGRFIANAIAKQQYKFDLASHGSSWPHYLTDQSKHSILILLEEIHKVKPLDPYEVSNMFEYDMVTYQEVLGFSENDTISKKLRVFLKRDFNVDGCFIAKKSKQPGSGTGGFDRLGCLRKDVLAQARLKLNYLLGISSSSRGLSSIVRFTGPRDCYLIEELNVLSPAASLIQSIVNFDGVYTELTRRIYTSLCAKMDMQKFGLSLQTALIVISILTPCFEYSSTRFLLYLLAMIPKGGLFTESKFLNNLYNSIYIAWRELKDPHTPTPLQFTPPSPLSLPQSPSIHTVPDEPASPPAVETLLETASKGTWSQIDKVRAARLLPTLLKTLTKEWLNNAAMRRAFLIAYSTGVPQQCGDLSDNAFLGKQRDRIIKPLEQFLNEKKNSSAARCAVMQILEHFQIYCSNPETLAGSALQALVSVREGATASSSDTSAQLLGPTLFNLVEADFRRLVNRKQSLLSQEESPSHRPITVFISQDGENAKTFFTRLGLDSLSRLRSVETIGNQEAMGLLSKIATGKDLITNEWGLLEVNLSVDELKRLQEEIQTAVPHTLYAINLVREVLPSGAIHRAGDSLALEDDAAEESIEIYSSSDEDDSPFEGSDNRLEDDLVRKRVRSDDDEEEAPNPKPIKKQRGFEGRCTNRSELRSRGKFNAEVLSEGSKVSLNGSGKGDLPAQRVILPSVPGNALFHDMDPDDPWLVRSFNTLEVVSVRLKTERARRKALEGISLDYPILSRLTSSEALSAEANRGVDSLHPGVKDYQREMVNKWLNLRGLAWPIIAAEPGLGKTWIACEVLARMLLEQVSGGTVFFLGPKATINQTCNRIRSYLLDLYAASWKARYKAYSEGKDSDFPNDLQMQLADFIIASSVERWQKLLPTIACSWDVLKDTSSFEVWSRRQSSLIRMRNGAIAKRYEERFGASAPLLPLPGDLREQVGRAAQMAEALSPIEAATVLLDQAKRLGSWPIPDVVNCSTAQELKDHLAEQQTGRKQIIVSSPHAFVRVDPGALSGSETPLVILDEAQIAHTYKKVAKKNIAESNTSIRQAIQERFDHLRSIRRTDVMLMTGTPLENHLSELWALLNLAHSDKLFPPQIQQALVECLSDIETSLRDLVVRKEYGLNVPEDEQAAIKDKMLRAFAQLHVFALRVARPLALTLRMDSPAVREAWDGRLPSRRFKQVDVDVKCEAMKSAIASAFRNLGRGGALNQNHELMKILLGTRSLKHEESIVQEQVASIADESNSLDQIVDSRPFLGLLNKKSFRNGITKHRSMIVAVEHLVTADIVHAFITRLLKEMDHTSDRKVFLVNGETSVEDRKRIIEECERENGILILTVKAGGVGLDLPFATKLFDLTAGVWNPAILGQLHARISRVGHPGKRTVYTPSFGTEQESHYKILREQKTKLSDFVFDTFETPSHHVESFGQYLKASAFKGLLNFTRAKSLADIEGRRGWIDAFIANLCSNVTREEIKKYVDAATPKVEILSAASSSSASSSSSSMAGPSMPSLWLRPLTSSTASSSSGSSSSSSSSTPGPSMPTIRLTPLKRATAPSSLGSSSSSSSSTPGPSMPTINPTPAIGGFILKPLMPKK
jgi:hypothetical protein